MTSQEQEELRRIKTGCTYQGVPVSLPDSDLGAVPHAADAHCHIDLMLARMGVSTYAEAKEKFIYPDEPVDVNLQIPCYAFPEMWPTAQTLQSNPQSAYNIAIGFHPRSALEYYPKMWRQFLQVTEYHQCVAIGEVGLDYTRGVTEDNIKKQYWCLAATVERALGLNKPLVVHCRGGKNLYNRSATLDCITILQQILPKTFPVYVHCFTGGKADYQQWMKAFPSCMFGFTGAILHPKKRHHELLEVICAIDIGCVLLETDAPLLLPPKYYGVTKISNSYMLVDIAKEIAQLKQILTAEVLEATHHNTHCFFQLIEVASQH